MPSHDQNDAAVAAPVAAAADNRVSGMSVVAIGEALSADLDGTLREGPMIIPRLDPLLIERLSDAVPDGAIPELPSQRVTGAVEDPPRHAADKILDYLITKVTEGNPEICTYAWAYRALFNASYEKFSQAYTKRVVDAARSTRPRELPGLGLVRLDTFIVSIKDRLPSDGYWSTASHDRQTWLAVFGTTQPSISNQSIRDTR